MERSESGEWRCSNPPCAYARAKAKGQRLFAAAATLVLLLLPALAGAQPTVNPSAVEFDPSPDHAAKAPNGDPLVSEYILSIYVSGQTAVIKSISLGKPSPEQDGKIRAVVMAALASALKPSVTYEARVGASGPGGISASTASNQFTLSAICGVTLTASSYAIAPLGGKGSINLASSTNCNWTTTSSAPWLTVTAGASGTGDATVVFAAPLNSDLKNARTATLTIGDQVLTVTQDVVTCTYEVTPTSLPLQTPVAVSGELFGWPALDADRRALRRAGPGRVAAAWFGNSLTVDLTVAPGQAQQLAVYIADFDGGRQETLDVLSDTGAVLDSRPVTNFSGGQYLVWTVRGHVTVRVTKIAGPNALVSGVFLGSASAATGSGSAATYVTTDTTTGGDWPGVYGVNGYAVAKDETTRWLSASGGAGALNVVTPPVACGWTAASDAPWLTVSPSSGSGSAAVAFTVAPNTTTAQRTGTLTVGGQALKVTQAAAVGQDPCAAPFGSETLSIFVTRVSQAGARTWVSVQAGSKSPVRRLTAKVDGVEVEKLPRDVDADVSGSAGMWFPTPAKGTHRVSVLGRNQFGCAVEAFALLDFIVK